ncbi:MAG: asparagine synthase (glutamine-hydrolyzing) [Candidatus Micrarchaeota archaeon]
MCGIAGFAGLEDKKLLKKMLDVISYRGPDDWGVYIDNGVGLGNRRLSIIDLKTGKQPIHSEDGDVWVVYNGEIYNYKNLRCELEKKKHKFHTASDTEVLVHAYEEWGEGFVRRLRGIWAFALWDSRRKKLLLARDELGVKPLYYAPLAGKLFFGSEIKCMLQNAEIKRKLNQRALECFLAFGSVFGEETLFEGIKKILPGHLLAWGKGSALVSRYWEPVMEPRAGGEAEFAARIKNLLSESVEIELMSDVPLGAFLSGGVDSSAVGGLMSRFVKKPVKTFTVGFGESDDEVEYARAVSEHFGTDHRELMVDMDRVVKLVPRLAWHFDDLTGDAAAVPTYFVSELARNHVKVVLTGEGGDELFAGYNRYKLMSGALWFVPKSFRINFFKKVVSIFNEREMAAMLPATRGANAFKRFLSPYFETRADLLNQALLWGIVEVLPNQLLSKVDRTTMARSLEARVPFLDKEMVALAGELPTHLKMRGLTGKYILRKALSELVPRQILQRKKHGFDVPLLTWFSGELGEYALQTLSDKHARLGRYVKGFEKFIPEKMHLSDKRHARKVWHLLMLELWLKTFMEKEKPRAL